jgi:hypothetical protein
MERRPLVYLGDRFLSELPEGDTVVGIAGLLSRVAYIEWLLGISDAPRLLLEDGSRLLLEDGSGTLLEIA